METIDYVHTQIYVYVRVCIRVHVLCLLVSMSMFIFMHEFCYAYFNRHMSMCIFPVVNGKVLKLKLSYLLATSKVTFNPKGVATAFAYNPKDKCHG